MNSNVLFENNRPPQENQNLPVEKEVEPSRQKFVSRGGVFTYPIERLIKKYQESLRPPRREEVTTIHVDEIASRIAHFYERIRKIIDWKEENLLRRNAIQRILKRNLITEISGLKSIFKIDIDKIAEPLVLELIRGGHLPNDQIPQEKIGEVRGVLKKYYFLLRNAPFSEANSSFVLKKKVNFYDWILEIAACEIEEVLSPPVKENALIETMTVLMNERIRVIPKERISEEDKVIQTYVAAHRTLFDLDDAIIAYHLLKYRFHQWTCPTETFLQETAKDIFSIWQTIESDLNHPLGREFFNICERTDTVFTILSDTLDFYKKDPEQILKDLADRESFRALITQFYNKRLETLKSRLFRMGVFSTLSVFVSNWFTFFIVEVPLAHLFYQGFNTLATTVDFIVPSLAMFALVAIIRPPPSSNLKAVVEMIFSFVYEGEEKSVFEIKLRKKRRFLTTLIIALLYLAACLGSFGAIAWVFTIAAIPVTSVILDTMTIALNVFAALVIRNKAKEITVEEKSSFWEFFLDVLSIPMAQIGNWLARKWREYNVVSVFFNVVIEMPFITVIEFIEDWRNFLKERKAEIH
jgi:hypothetical protein